MTTKNPANNNDLGGALYQILKKFLQSEVDNRLPAIIETYDRKLNRAKVKILVAMQDKDKKVIPRQPIASVHVLNFGGGDGVLSFNLKKGDLGWILSTDRDIADFLTKYAETTSTTKRTHDFSAGVFMPDVLNQKKWTIAEEDAENMVLQSLDGTKRISFFDDKIKITSPKLLIDAEAEFTKNVKIDKSLIVEETSTAQNHISEAGGFNEHKHLEMGDGAPTGTPI